MADHSLYQFRLFFRDMPTIFDDWRAYDDERRWDRHYLLGEGMSLRIDRGERIELSRWGEDGQFWIEHTILSCAFPLDWMALSCIARALPRELRQCEVDGRSAQTFVDSLAVPDLVQASVLKHDRHLREGSVMATLTTLSVPDWGALAITCNLVCHAPHNLHGVLARAGMDRYRHFGLDEWLAREHGRFTAAKAAATEAAAALDAGAAPAAESAAVREPA